MSAAELLDFRDYSPQTQRFAGDVLDGLQAPVKTLPCKYFYDEAGSRLFDRICELEEYYPTRTEAAIMQRCAGEMADCLGERLALIEYGSGSSTKTRILLDHLRDAAAYVPIDISREHLLRTAARLSAAYPRLRVLPVCADYTGRYELPDLDGPAARRIVYFPGSTIGNFHPGEAADFLIRIAEVAGSGGGLLIGVDLKKDARLLEAAYNDGKGVTAAFNLNLLERINREVGADFDMDSFRHHAFYNRPFGRIEMHLVSRHRQVVRVAGVEIPFRKGETIWTESSYKYRADEFASLAAQAGFRLERLWTDPVELFSVQYLTVAS